MFDVSPGPVINRHIYGHFAEHLGRCIYEGIWVGENSPVPHVRGIRHAVIAALKRLEISVLGWRRGYFADEYHRRGGIGPCAHRPRRIDTHWCGVIEPNERLQGQPRSNGQRAAGSRAHRRRANASGEDDRILLTLANLG